MRTISTKAFKENNKILIITLVALLIISVAISIYSMMQPTTTTNEFNNNTSQLETIYDYKATIIPNILNPNGGTVEVGDTIFKKITTAIPVYLKSTINSEVEVNAKGTNHLQLVVKAGEFWEKIFPLQEIQSFELKGTEISILNNTYNINLEKVKSFITQVEEETGIRSNQYTIEVLPNIQGTISYGAVKKEILMDDKLIFQYSNDEIKLVSEKIFTSVVPFTTTEKTTNMFNIFGLSLPLIPVRITSSILSILLLIPTIFGVKKLLIIRVKPIKTQVEKINKKYRSRIITVSKELNGAQKSIITLQSFKSILQISDEKELPIFFSKVHQDGSAVYFIVDGDYLYNFETGCEDLVRNKNKDTGIIRAYAES